MEMGSLCGTVPVGEPVQGWAGASAALLGDHPALAASQCLTHETYKVLCRELRCVKHPAREAEAP